MFLFTPLRNSWDHSYQTTGHSVTPHHPNGWTLIMVVCPCLIPCQAFQFTSAVLSPTMVQHQTVTQHPNGWTLTMVVCPCLIPCQAFQFTSVVLSPTMVQHQKVTQHPNCWTLIKVVHHFCDCVHDSVSSDSLV